MTVVVVTDTSCRLPADLREQWSIRQVPLHILLDGLDLRDGVDEIPDDIHKRHATTAGPVSPISSALNQRPPGGPWCPPTERWWSAMVPARVLRWSGWRCTWICG